MATYGYNRGRFDDIGSNGEPQEFGGNRFRLSPDHTVSVGANYEFSTPIGDAFIAPNYSYQSRVFFEDENQEAFNIVTADTGALLASVPAFAQDGYGVVNLRAGLHINNGAVSINAYVQNLLNQDYVIDAGNLGGDFGIPTFIAGPPRFFGGSVAVQF